MNKRNINTVVTHSCAESAAVLFSREVQRISHNRIITVANFRRGSAGAFSITEGERKLSRPQTYNLPRFSQIDFE